MSAYHALISINGQLVNPLAIISIDVIKGRRDNWGWLNDCKLWHPAINMYINKLPWWKRIWAKYHYAVCPRFNIAYVSFNISGDCYIKSASFSSNAKAIQYADEMTKKWDDGLSKFHGDIK
jgi:hypothetical protein